MSENRLISRTIVLHKEQFCGQFIYAGLKKRCQVWIKLNGPIETIDFRFLIPANSYYEMADMK